MPPPVQRPGNQSKTYAGSCSRINISCINTQRGLGPATSQPCNAIAGISSARVALGGEAGRSTSDMLTPRAARKRVDALASSRAVADETAAMLTLAS